MPELPEVEVCRQGLAAHLTGATITGAVVRFPRLREPLPENLSERLAGRHITKLLRRGKYLLLACDAGPDRGWLLIHLGMSGSLRITAPSESPGKHDHFDLVVGEKILRLTDPRRFGLVDWFGATDIERHRRLADLGVEPLSAAFTGAWLYAVTRQRATPIKTLLMDAHVVVGIGNIYAAEALFRAAISPTRPAGRLGRQACERLVTAIRATLDEAIAAGGSSIRDYVHHDGGSGYFQVTVAVYGRTGLPCPRCGTPVRQIRQAGRSTFYCADCQR